MEGAIAHGGPTLRETGQQPKFAVGDAVVTRKKNPHGHTRLPRYARGTRGNVVLYHGAHVLPDTSAHGLGECPEPLYTVRFEAAELWGEDAEKRDTVHIDLWESYLDCGERGGRMSHDHDHAVSELEVRTRALESLLYEKGLLTPAAVDTLIGAFEEDLGPLNGARVVARAWVDPGYKRRLLEDATPAIAELGFGGIQAEHLVAVENTPDVHNVVVLHALLLLPVAGARIAASLVQGAAPTARAS